MNRLANVCIGFVLFLGLTGIPASSQTQTSSSAQNPSSAQGPASGGSLGDYARQVRKDSGSTAKPKVFDNDNLPREDTLSIVGSATSADDSASAKAPEPTAPEAKPAADAKTGTDDKTAAADKPADGKSPADDAKQAMWKEWGDKIKAQQDAIDLAARELDVLQREYKMRAAAMYSDVGNRLRNSADWDKEDADYKQKIDAKQKALDDAKQKLEDLQEEARKAGVPSSVREP
jgi:hypothetical protein